MCCKPITSSASVNTFLSPNCIVHLWGKWWAIRIHSTEELLGWEEVADIQYQTLGQSQYLWCKAGCCSDHSSSSWQARDRGAWPPCGRPRTSRRYREPGWRGPEPERSSWGRAGSESDGTGAPAWPHTHTHTKEQRQEDAGEKGGSEGNS